MTQDSVEDVEDSQLLAEISPRSWEERVNRLCMSNWSAVGYFLAAGVLVGTVAYWSAPLNLGVIGMIAVSAIALIFWAIFGILAVVLAFATVEYVTTYRSRFARQELNRRYGCALPTYYVQEVREAMASANGPERLAVLTAHMLPRGGTVFLRLHITNTGTGTLDIRAKVDGYQLTAEPKTDVPELHAARIELDAEECEHAARLIEEGASGSVSFPSNVRDGMPCSLIVGNRGSMELSILNCNLAGLGPEPRPIHWFALRNGCFLSAIALSQRKS